MTPRRASMSRFAASLGALSAVILSGGLLAGQNLPGRQIVYTSAIPAPVGTTAEDFEPPPSPMELRAAFAAGAAGVVAANSAAEAVVPEVPWTEHGLARTPIDPASITFDEERDRWIAPLDDGRIAVLTLEPSVQRHLEGVVSRYEEPGEAIVAIEPSTGRVIGMVDDGADPAIHDGLARRRYAWAASTFKVITGAAFLAEGIATPETTVCYSGGSSGFELANLEPSDNDEICLTLTEAMAWSANLVFARIADQHLAPEQLQYWAERFGYNTSIPFELPLERSVAEIPEDRLEFARSAAGFRHTRLSPLHGALIQAAIANDGVMMVPTIVDHIETADGEVVYTHRPAEWRTVLGPGVNARLVETLSETCSEGTARAYFAQRDGWPSTVRVWGKTGTLSNREVDGSQPDQAYLFTWFTGFAEQGDDAVAVGGLVVNTPTWWIKGSYLAAEAVLASVR